MSAILKHDDLWAIIQSYSGTVEDIFNLAATNNHFYHTQIARNGSFLQKFSIQSFRILLQIFNLPLEEFVVTLSSTGATISGSFAH
jgi:hypothetical protein